MASKHEASERVHWVLGMNERNTRCGRRAWRLQKSVTIEAVTCQHCRALYERDHAPAAGPTPEQIEAERAKAARQAQRQYASRHYAQNRAAILEQSKERYAKNREAIKARQRARYAERKAKREADDGN